MTDPKRSPDKVRKPFFPWKRQSAREAIKPAMLSDTDPQPLKHPWYRSTSLKIGGTALCVLLIVPNHAHGQFGIDTAAIMAALSKMQSLMNTYIAAPLKTISQYEQSAAKYEQQVMYPLTAINQAKSSVVQSENQFTQMSNMFRTMNVSSATLPQSQNLESLLLSRNAANVPTVSTQFQQVYGVVMAQNTTSSAVRTMTDMTDAQAQDSMKRAIEIDALAKAELNEADQMGQQITQAAPGSAPILEAEADVWVVRANAYTQAALAELMRTRGIDLANQSKLAKLATTNNTGNNSLINGSLTNR
jgi:septal ring factor EnvC (AmiA/AmiB activator)